MSRKHPHAKPDVSEMNVMPTEHDVDAPGDPEVSELVAEIKESADKLAKDEAKKGDLKILARTMKELRYAFKVFTPFRKNRKVTVFGSARTDPEHPAYQQAVEFGKHMANEEWYVVTGAGGGVMEAAHVGAGREMSMGLNIMLPFEQSSNYIIEGDKKLVTLKYFFTRKLLFVKEVHAIVCFPGGFGTQDEAFETLTLVQTGKRDLMPIVMIEPEGSRYWEDWLVFIKERLLADGLISAEDLSLFRVTHDVQEAADEIFQFYCVYNSMRYIKDRLVLRLHEEPSEEFVERLNEEFSSILVSGTIEKVSAHPFEEDEEHLIDLPRLSLHFNRRDIGRLRELVDTINRELGDC